LEGETPPPGAGFETDTLPEPAVAKSCVVKFTVNCDELTNVVARGLPFQFTTEVCTKPVPATLTAKGPIVPAVALGGVNPVMVGAPFATGLTTNVSALEGPPGSGFETVT
jgi:hypothetical protein